MSINQFSKAQPVVTIGLFKKKNVTSGGNKRHSSSGGNKLLLQPEVTNIFEEKIIQNVTVAGNIFIESFFFHPFPIFCASASYIKRSGNC